MVLYVVFNVDCRGFGYRIMVVEFVNVIVEFIVMVVKSVYFFGLFEWKSFDLIFY